MPDNRTGGRAHVTIAALAGILVCGCTDLTDEEFERLLEMEMTQDALGPSPTNAVADDPAAVALGRRLFFDRSMSSDGTVGCVSCHDPERGWSDPRAVSLGVRGRPGDRHAMPVTMAAHQSFLLWDGRADSLWSQALKAIENPKEMDFSRTQVAHLVATDYAADYEDVFGERPDLEGVPPDAHPGTPAWAAVPSAQRHEVERAFVNVGKALEAYEREVSCTDTRFDRWLRGEVELSRREEVGAANFVREGCIDCHSGPAFSDGGFHNIGIGSGTDVPDEGRAVGALMLLDDPFNGVGPFSDDVDYGARKLEHLADEGRGRGAFRTPSLRGVAQRRSFGHRGHQADLRDFLDDVYDDPHLQGSAVGTLDEQVRGVDLDRERAMVAFLETLDCPPLPAELLEP